MSYISPLTRPTSSPRRFDRRAAAAISHDSRRSIQKRMVRADPKRWRSQSDGSLSLGKWGSHRKGYRASAYNSAEHQLLAGARTPSYNAIVWQYRRTSESAAVYAASTVMDKERRAWRSRPIFRNQDTLAADDIDNPEHVRTATRVVTVDTGSSAT